MKKALVCGAGGFIGGHLVKYLKDKGYWMPKSPSRHHHHRLSAERPARRGKRALAEGEKLESWKSLKSLKRWSLD